MLNNPFHIKPYESYEKYLCHQKSKLENGINWLEQYELAYYKVLSKWLSTSKLKTKGTSSLCIGARTGTEVRVFNDLGSFSVGIDVNPGKENKYVVWGDASDIQYADNTIDIVYTNSLDHFLKIEEVLSEIKRVLKPDGHFVFLIGSPKDSRIDKHGSTYWDDVTEVLNYISQKYNFKLLERYDMNKSKINIWFSDFVVMRSDVQQGI